MKTPEQMAEEHANIRCPEQGPEFVVWCMCRDDFLAGYRAAINFLKKLDSWISVKERLPEDKESVIYWHDLHGTNIGHYDSTFPKPNYHWWSYNYGDHADFRVQWWMPLPKIPEPPKGEE